MKKLDFRVHSYQCWIDGQLYAVTFWRGLAGRPDEWSADFTSGAVAERIGSYQRVYEAFAACELHHRLLIEARAASEELRRVG